MPATCFGQAGPSSDTKHKARLLARLLSSLTPRLHSGLGRFIVQFSTSHTQTHTQTHPVGLLCTSDQLAPHAAAYTISQQTQETTVHIINGIRTHDLSNRAAAELCLRVFGQVTCFRGEERRGQERRGQERRVVSSTLI